MDIERISGCEVCKILESPDELIVARTDSWNVALAPDQLYLGRVYITALRHIPTVAAQSEAELLEWHAIITRFERAVTVAFGATHVTYAALMNNAYAEPEPKPHLHWHVRPRYAKPPSFGDFVFPDVLFGSHHDRDRSQVLMSYQLRDIADRLRAEFLGA